MEHVCLPLQDMRRLVGWGAVLHHSNFKVVVVAASVHFGMHLAATLSALLMILLGGLCVCCSWCSVAMVLAK